MRLTRCLALLALVAVAPTFTTSSAQAGPARVPRANATLEHNARLRLVLGDRIGGAFHSAARPTARDTVPLVIRADRDLDAAMLADLSRAGFVPSMASGTPLVYGDIAVGRATLVGATALRKHPRVRSIQVAPPPTRLPPLDHSAKLIGLSSARAARADVPELTGKGTTVADIDSNVDIYHPHFFHGDGGYFDWIDVDKDGSFSPEKDAIDFNRNGVADAGEGARWLKAETTFQFYGNTVPGRTDTFDPGIDWVYLDTNGNNQRDYGKSAGFDESTPGFGEPMFVPDDVNQNGRLDPGERLILLKTSKFKKVFVRVNYGTANVDHVYVRGTDLITHKTGLAPDAFGYSDALHATGVLSIVAGDVPLPSRRWVGIAPEAELLLGFQIDDTQMDAVTWAIREKPDVMLHETANWTGAVLDGSDDYSYLVDASSKRDNISHTCPVGNTGGARKHTRAVIEPGQSRTLAFDNPAGSSRGTASYIDVSINVRGGLPSAVALVTQDGKDSINLLEDSQKTLTGGAVAYALTGESERGTHFFHTVMYAADVSKTPLPTGRWSLTLKAPATLSTTVDAYLSDDVSGWGELVAWDASIATDDRTIGIPAVSDSCIAIGAHTGHAAAPGKYWWDDPEREGEVRGYSGRGPRIDGAQKPDITAPDNPWAAAAAGRGQSATIELGSFAPFGGTSGAGPHVTGVTALMAQAGIRGESARSAIRKGAITDSVTGAVPNFDYGYGRLSAAGSLAKTPAGAPPTVTLRADPNPALPGSQVSVIATVTDPDGQGEVATIRWDEGYDGTWDTDYTTSSTHVVTSKAAGMVPVKVRARDGSGRVAEAVVSVVFDERARPIVVDAGVDAREVPGTTDGSRAGSDADSAEPPTPVDSSSGACSTAALPGTRRGGPGTWFGLGSLALGLGAAARWRSRRGQRR